MQNGDIFCQLLFLFVRKKVLLFMLNNVLSLCFFALKLAKLRIGIQYARYKVAEKAYKNLIHWRNVMKSMQKGFTLIDTP